MDDETEITEQIEVTDEAPTTGAFIHIEVTADGNLQMQAESVSAANLWAASKMLDFHATQLYVSQLQQMEAAKIQLVRGGLTDFLGKGGKGRN